MTRVSFVLALTSLLVTQTAIAAAGKVLFAAGTVTLERNGERVLQAGDVLEVGDVLATGEQSRAQILLADGARIALRANSRLRIDALELPSSVQRPGTPVAAASFGKSVGTLLKGGFSARTGVIGKNNLSGYELHTPIGTLGIRDAQYTAVFCRDGDCADAPGFPAGQPIADGLYLVVDDGTITFKGRDLSLTLTAPAIELIPVEAGDPQQLADAPAFLRSDGAGRLEAASRTIRIGASNEPLTSDVNARRGPDEVPEEVGDAATALLSSSAPDRPILATTTLGRSVDLIVPESSAAPHASMAVAVPGSGQQAFTTTTTQPVGALAFSAAGNLLAFDAPSGTGVTSPTALYRTDTAALLGSGSNGASGLRWGRWSTGAATAATSAGVQTLPLANESLHWIVGPTFELAPILPTSGSTNFVLAGGTDPTDTSGHIGTLGRAVLTANFTTQQVSTTLSLDIDGLNWLASGTGSLTAGTVRFGGAFSNVLVDGRVHGSGDFDGFFSAGPMTPDQLNGVGLAYQLRDSLDQLGTVSGVAAFVPGTGPTPVVPTVSRDVAYAIGSVGVNLQATGSASDRLTQLATEVGGNLTAFTAPLDGAKGAIFRLNMGTIANTGFDAETGIRWGRWEEGNIYVTPPSSTTVKSDLTGEALHWLVDSSYGAAPVIPRSGTADYALVGDTNPTDTLGNVGTLGQASFSADFTNRTVISALALTMSGHNWFARGSGTFAANSTLFDGTYDTVSIDNLIVGAGNFSGFFTMPRVGGGTVAGAGLAYNIVGNPADLGIVTGAAAFQQGAGTTLTPPPLSARDIAYLVPITGFDETQVVRTSEKEYAVDDTFSLRQMLVRSSGGEPATLSIGTSQLAESAASGIVMMRWGRWSGGELIDTILSSGATSTIALGQSSLHWIESADSATPPVIPTTGTASYQLIGATTPTDRLGHLGTLNSATFNADFTAQLVNSSVDITINGESWKASGVGSIGASRGLQSNQFGGSFTSGAVGASALTPGGSFSGFFTNPSGATGVPLGAGFTYTVTDPIAGTSVDGAAVFRKP